MIRVAQVGTFDVDNLGDLLFPLVFRHIIDDIQSELNTSIDCGFFSPRGCAEASLYSDQLGCKPLDELARADAQNPFDLIFIGGGDIIRDDDESLSPLYGDTFLKPSFSALCSPVAGPEKRLVLLTPGVPFSIAPEFELYLANSFKRVRMAALRDKLSLERVADLLPPDVHAEVTPDMVSALPNYLPRQSLIPQHGSRGGTNPSSGNYVCVQVHPVFCPDIESTGNTLRKLEQLTGATVILANTGDSIGECDFVSRLARRHSFDITTLARPRSIKQRVATIAGARGVVCASLHMSVLAHAYGVPHFNYSRSFLGKVRGFYEQCNSGTSYSNFDEFRSKLDDVCARIRNRRSHDDPGLPGLAVDEGKRIRNFVRNAINSVAPNGFAGATGFSTDIDVQYRRMHVSRRYVLQSLEKRTAQLAEIERSFSWQMVSAARAALERHPRMQKLTLELARAMREATTPRVLASWLDSRKKRGARHHVRKPLGDSGLLLPLGWQVPATGAPSVAVVCHIYFSELAAEFKDYLSNIPFRANLYLTTDSEDKRQRLLAEFSSWDKGSYEVRLVPNRGRDIAPKLIACSDVHRNHEYVLHLHSKRSEHLQNLSGWRRFLLDTLLGSSSNVRSIFEIFRLLPSVGLIAPMHFEPIFPRLGWGSNFACAKELGRRLGFALDIDAPMDFPSGSMFWARGAALRPLLDLGLTSKDFPEELGQVDGTLAHAIERLFFHACETAGYDWLKVGFESTTRSGTGSKVRVRTPADLRDYLQSHHVRRLTNRDPGARLASNNH